MRLFLSVALIAAVPALNAQVPANPAFKPLEFFVGSCWTGMFPDGKQTDEHCFEWVYGGKFVRDKHVVRGAPALYQGETIYRIDTATGKLAYWYWGSEGMSVTGTVEDANGMLRFPSRIATPSGDVEIIAEWTRTGPDSYRVRQAQKKDGAWVELWTMELKRSGRP